MPEKKSFDPFQISKYQDLLSAQFPSHLTRPLEDKISPSETYPIGSHQTCHGEIYLIKSSQTHHALLCRKCYLRISVPVTCKTYNDLKKKLNSI